MPNPQVKTTSPYLSYFYSALASPFGISLSVSDPGQAKAKLYSARASAADTDLAQISIHQSPYFPESELWLVKRPKRGSANGPVSSENPPGEPVSNDAGSDDSMA